MFVYKTPNGLVYFSWFPLENNILDLIKYRFSDLPKLRSTQPLRTERCTTTLQSTKKAAEKKRIMSFYAAYLNSCMLYVYLFC